MTFHLSTKPVFIPSTLPLKIVRQRSDLRRRTIFFCEPDGLQSDCDFLHLGDDRKLQGLNTKRGTQS